ncbi:MULTISPECIES: hypothetical protein [Jannaschia]|uniref:hypothetical protein n=1 Tax=Jannaschia TaxID=188905 RepID=UPI001C7D0B3B|nr:MULTISPECIES: hypothetical protein [unclassified Jannaschia]
MAHPAHSTVPLPDRHLALLTFLRLAALECRASSRLDLTQACKVLDPEIDAGDLATILARALPQVLFHRPQILAPGALGRSFDEDWLLALADAIARGDRLSERFLLRRRCHPHRASHLSLLLRELEDRLAA